MHILIIPSWYPVAQNRMQGIYFKEQAEAVGKYDTSNKVGVISAASLSIMQAFRRKNFRYGVEETVDNNFFELIFNFPAIPKNKSINKFIASYMGKKMFLRYIQEHGLPDIIHLHSFELGDLTVWIKKTYNISFLYTEHASAHYYNRLTEKEEQTMKMIVKYSSSNFAVSQHLALFLSKKYNANFEMLPNFIDTEFFTCKEKKKEPIFTFINIAGLNPGKNHVLLLKTFKNLHIKYPEIKLLIYGEGPTKNLLYSLAKDLNILKFVTFGGHIGRQEVKENLCRSHCFVLTSRFETFGVVAIEAMSCGLPVITTKNGGTESIVVEDKLGILCEQNEKNLYLAMEKIYLNYKSYNPTYIKNYIIENFSEKSIVKRLLNVYNETLINK